MKNLLQFLLVSALCIPSLLAQTAENIKIGQWGSFDASQAFHAAPFKVTDSAPAYCNAGVDFYWAPTSHTLSFCSTQNVWTAFATGTGSGLNPMGVAGIPYETGAGVATRSTTSADFINLFNGGTCSGYLKSDGTCATPGGASYTNGTGLGLTGNTFSVLYGTTVNTAAQGNDARIGNATKFNGTDITAFNGFPFFTTGTLAAGRFSNIVNLWTSCTAGWLKFDGTCSAPAGGVTINGVFGTTFTFDTLATSGYGTKTVTSGGVDTVSEFMGGRTGTVTTDNVTQSDCNGNVNYTSATATTATVSQTPTNILQGCTITLTNQGAGTVTVNATVSKFNGTATSLTLSPGNVNTTSATFYTDASGNFTVLNLNNGSGGGVPVQLNDSAGNMVITTNTPGAGAGADYMTVQDNSSGSPATVAVFVGSATDADVREVHVPKGGGEFAVTTMYSTKIATIASAATIAPINGFIHVTGSTAINTITPLIGCTTVGYSCVVRILPDPGATFTFTTAGNLYWAPTVTVGHVLTFSYDPTTTKWYSSN